MDKKEWEDSITPVFDLDHFYEIESIRKMRESLEDNRSKWWGHLPANKYKMAGGHFHKYYCGC